MFLSNIRNKILSETLIICIKNMFSGKGYGYIPSIILSINKFKKRYAYTQVNLETTSKTFIYHERIL